MSDVQRGPDWWLASDGRWYPPADPVRPPRRRGLLVAAAALLGVAAAVVVVAIATRGGDSPDLEDEIRSSTPTCAEALLDLDRVPGPVPSCIDGNRVYTAFDEECPDGSIVHYNDLGRWREGHAFHRGGTTGPGFTSDALDRFCTE